MSAFLEISLFNSNDSTARMSLWLSSGVPALQFGIQVWPQLTVPELWNSHLMAAFPSLIFYLSSPYQPYTAPTMDSCLRDYGHFVSISENGSSVLSFFLSQSYVFFNAQIQIALF